MRARNGCTRCVQSAKTFVISDVGRENGGIFQQAFAQFCGHQRQLLKEGLRRSRARQLPCATSAQFAFAEWERDLPSERRETSRNYQRLGITKATDGTEESATGQSSYPLYDR